MTQQNSRWSARALRRGQNPCAYCSWKVRDGLAADNAIAAEPYSAVLLDLGLPRRDGFEVLLIRTERGMGYCIAAGDGG